MKGMLTIRFLIVSALFGAVAHTEDITLPLGDGNLLVRAQFIWQNPDGTYVPELTLKLKNQTFSSWRTLKLQFDVGGLCNGKPRQWTLPVLTSLGWSEDHQLIQEHTETVISLIGEVNGCKAEIVKAQLLFAENLKHELFDFPVLPIDLSSELEVVRVKRDAEAAVQAEKERKAAEVQAKKDADAGLRRKQLAIEQKRKQAEADAQRLKVKTEEDAEAAEKRRRVRAACTEIYKNTIDKKVKDLTVREEQQVRACQVLGMYPPQ
jgi:hypothetical protein